MELLKKQTNQPAEPQLTGPNGEPLAIPEFYANSIAINVSPIEVEL